MIDLMSLLAIDVGSTNLKVAVFNIEGELLAYESREYRLISPKDGWMEVPAQQVFSIIKELIKKVAAETRQDPVEAIAVSSQGEAVVPIDKNGTVLNDAPMRFDNRVGSIYEQWKVPEKREQIYKVTGMPLHPQYSINKILWFKEQRPALFEKTWKFLCLEDFIIYQLSRQAVTDYSLASRTMAFDIHKKEWSDQVLAEAGLEKSLFPKVQQSGELVGTIERKLAQELGLREDVAIATGGHDQACGSLGSGVIQSGIAANSFGTSDAFTCIVNTFNPTTLQKTLDKSLPCYPHAKKNAYMTIISNFSGGALLKWWRDNFGEQEVSEARKTGKSAYDLILGKATDSPVDTYCVPHFAGSGAPVLNPRARGAFFGVTLNTTKHDLIRAVADGINYQAKFNIELLEDIGGNIEEIRSTGGGAKSRKLLQQRADVTGKKVCSLKTSEAVSLGTAILAGKALGKYASLEEAVEQVVHIKEVFLPDSAVHEVYKEKYQNYLHCQDQLYQVNKIY